jgi:hypothetical protein
MNIDVKPGDAIRWYYYLEPDYKKPVQPIPGEIGAIKLQKLWSESMDMWVDCVNMSLTISIIDDWCMWMTPDGSIYHARFHDGLSCTRRGSVALFYPRVGTIVFPCKMFPKKGTV